MGHPLLPGDHLSHTYPLAWTAPTTGDPGAFDQLSRGGSPTPLPNE